MMRFIIYLILLFTCGSADDVTTRQMYNSMAQLVGEAKYPDNL